MQDDVRKDLGLRAQPQVFLSQFQPGTLLKRLDHDLGVHPYNPVSFIDVVV